MGGIRVLRYFSFSGEILDSITLEHFRKQLFGLKEKGYSLVSISTLLLKKEQNSKLIGLAMECTGRNVLDACKLLKEFGFAATIFVPTDFIGNEDFPTAKELKETWMELCSATRLYRNLLLRAAKSYDEFYLKTIEEEITKSKEEIEKISGIVCDGFCYPYGFYNEEIIEIVKRAGYKFALTRKSISKPVSNFELPSISVQIDDDLNSIITKIAGKENKLALPNYPSFSVVIPTYNNKDILELTITSLIAQDYPKDKYEILICDDGSSDGTKEMVLTVAKQAPISIRYFWQEDCGYRAGQARNMGINAAKGDIVLLINSDIISKKDNILQHARAHLIFPNRVVLGYSGGENTIIQYSLDKIIPILKKDIAKISELETFPDYRDIIWAKKLDNLSNDSRAWMGFYPTNTSIPVNYLKRAFDPDFKGWGAEDLELGFRLQKKLKFIVCRNAIGLNIGNQPGARSPFLTPSQESISEYVRNVTLFIQKHPEQNVIAEMSKYNETIPAELRVLERVINPAKLGVTKRILFYAIDGVGLGHILRTIIVASEIKKVRPEWQYIFITNSDCANIIESAGFSCIKVPPYRGDPRKSATNVINTLNNAEYEKLLQSIINTMEPHAIVYDWLLQEGIVKFAYQKSIKNILVLRKDSNKYLEEFLNKDSLKYLDYICFPHTKAEFIVMNVPNELWELIDMKNVEFIGQIVTEESRENMDIERNTDVLIAPGGGGWQDCVEFVSKSIEAFKELKKIEKNAKCKVITGPLFNFQIKDIPQDVEIVKYVPNFKAELRKAKIAITQAGYNICNDIVLTETPAMIVPANRLKEDTYERAKVFADLGAAIVLKSNEEITPALLKLYKNPELRKKLGESLKKYPLEIGNKKLAQKIIDLVEDTAYIELSPENQIKNLNKNIKKIIFSGKITVDLLEDSISSAKKQDINLIYYLGDSDWLMDSKIVLDLSEKGLRGVYLTVNDFDFSAEIKNIDKIIKNFELAHLSYSIILRWTEKPVQQLLKDIDFLIERQAVQIQIVPDKKMNSSELHNQLLKYYINPQYDDISIFISDTIKPMEPIIDRSSVVKDAQKTEEEFLDATYSLNKKKLESIFLRKGLYEKMRKNRDIIDAETERFNILWAQSELMKKQKISIKNKIISILKKSNLDEFWKRGNHKLVPKLQSKIKNLLDQQKSLLSEQRNEYETLEDEGAIFEKESDEILKRIGELSMNIHYAKERKENIQILEKNMNDLRQEYCISREKFNNNYSQKKNLIKNTGIEKKWNELEAEKQQVFKDMADVEESNGQRKDRLLKAGIYAEIKTEYDELKKIKNKTLSLSKEMRDMEKKIENSETEILNMINEEERREYEQLNSSLIEITRKLAKLKSKTIAFEH